MIYARTPLRIRIYSAKESNGNASKNRGVAKSKTNGVKNKLGNKMKCGDLRGNKKSVSINFCLSFVILLLLAASSN